MKKAKRKRERERKKVKVKVKIKRALRFCKSKIVIESDR